MYLIILSAWFALCNGYVYSCQNNLGQGLEPMCLIQSSDYTVLADILAVNASTPTSGNPSITLKIVCIWSSVLNIASVELGSIIQVSTADLLLYSCLSGSKPSLQVGQRNVFFLVENKRNSILPQYSMLTSCLGQYLTTQSTLQSIAKNLRANPVNRLEERFLGPPDTCYLQGFKKFIVDTPETKIIYESYNSSTKTHILRLLSAADG
jgi:hypothetical protein